MKKIPFFVFCNFLFVKTILFLSILFLDNKIVIAQDKPSITFGKVSPADFELPKSNIIDSNAGAVIIADVGNTSFVGNSKGWVSYVYKRRTRIKIIDKKAFEAATVNVSLYRNEDDEEKLDNIEGVSYNLENGKVAETRLDKKDIFEVKTDKNHFEKKFTMPAVKEGSVIEYSYSITSDFDFNLPEWEFQNIYYPCLWSEYNVNIPSLLTYVFIKRGFHKFFIDQQTEGHQNYLVREKKDPSLLASNDNSLTVSANVVKHKWVMKDLPGFNAESYISTPYNYADKIEFQLAQTYDGESTHDVSNSWKKATAELLNESDFAGPLSDDKTDFSKELEKIIGNENDALAKAKKIYYYIQDNITCTNHYNKYIKTSLQDVFKKRNGNVGEVNLLLAAMLRQAQIHTDPVLLSTTEYGYNSSTYPVMQRLNYVICRALINGQGYYLDAANDKLGFGMLAANCYNGHARIICNTDSASVYFEADSIKESKLTTVFIVNDEKHNGEMNGSLASTPGYIESYNIRNNIGKNGEKDFFKNIQLSFGPDIKIENTAIDSLEKLEDPVKVHYDFTFKADEGQDILYYSPIIQSSFKENPFKASERKYPVEMPYPINEIYLLHMEIPEGFIVDELPKSTKVAYNGDEGFFEYIIQKDGNNIQMRCSVKLSKAYFSSADYNSLRDFFAYVVKKQSEQIVFKKKK